MERTEADAAPGQLGLFAAIYSTRALRRFKPDPIPDDVLFQLFDAAIRAPSGGNAQDWRFVVITEPALKRQIQAWFWEAWQRYQPRYAAEPEPMDTLPRSRRLSLKSTDHLARHVHEAPAIVVPCGVRGKHSTPGGSIFPAVQNLLLAARALGLGGSITNFARAHEADLAAALGIPDEYQIYCLIPIGYPLDRPGPVRRRPVRQVVFVDGWERPWPFAEQQPDSGWSDRWLDGGRSGVEGRG
ncbi:MAG TPA: nitroreductase family protein [Dehalococcoidia bacterium]|jgi:nitroreductase